MEANSITISNKWRVFATAIFAATCILITLCFDETKNSINFWNDDNPNVASKTAFSGDLKMYNNTNFSKPGHVIMPSSIGYYEKETSMKCNIYEGEWVYNEMGSPLYQEHQCPFLSDQVSCRRNGRPDFDYEKWRWEARDCTIPRFDGIDMLERLRGKRVIIVGDSLNRNQWESLACLLFSSLHPSRAHVDVKNGVYKIFRATDYNCSVEFYWSPFLVQLEGNKPNGSKVLKLDTLSASAKQWRNADVMVFNTGHWWVHTGKLKAWDLFEHNGELIEEMDIESAFTKAMKTWANWVDQTVDTTKTSVFFRAISPEHKSKQGCYNETQPILDDSYQSTYPKIMREVVEKTIETMKTPVKYLKITKLSGYRKDAHPTIYARKDHKLSLEEKKKRPESFSDCSHWCLPGLPDTWNRLLYASIRLKQTS